MIIIASILMLIVISGIVAGSLNNGAFRNYNYRQSKYDAIVKPAAQKLHAVKQKIREESVISDIHDHWHSRVKRHESKQARDTVRIASQIQRGKDPRRIVQRTINRDKNPNNPVKLRDKELSLITGMRKSAQSGNHRAQQLSGRIHPSTGHTTGGLSGIGHRNPSSHMPQIRQTKTKRSVPVTGKAKSKIKNMVVGTPKDPRRG